MTGQLSIEIILWENNFYTIIKSIIPFYVIFTSAVPIHNMFFDTFYQAIQGVYKSSLKPPELLSDSLGLA